MVSAPSDFVELMSVGCFRVCADSVRLVLEIQVKSIRSVLYANDFYSPSVPGLC